MDLENVRKEILGVKLDISEYFRVAFSVFKILLKENLTGDIENRDVFMNGINQSYEYENMRKYDVINI